MADTQNKPETNQRQSKGERLFNWLTYGGIAGIGTFVVTIPIAYWAKYAGGAKLFQSASRGLQKVGMGEHTAEHALMTTATMQGGNLMIIPVKIAENHKPHLVEEFNRALGEKNSIDDVKKEPKQTWGSLFKARLGFAWLPVFASFKGTAMIIGEDKFAHFQDVFAKKVVCGPLGRETHRGGMETRSFRFGKIAALDLFATAATATLLFIGSRVFAGLRDKKHPQPEADARVIDVEATVTPVLEKTPEKPVKSFTEGVAPKAGKDGFAEAITAQKSLPTEPAQAF